MKLSVFMHLLVFLLGAKPPEIALAIMADIVAYKNGVNLSNQVCDKKKLMTTA